MGGTRRFGERRRRLASAAAMAAGALLALPTSALSFDSQLFTVNIASQGKLQESGDLFGFDTGLAVETTYGPSLLGKLNGLEVSEVGDDAPGDPPEQYGYSIDQSTSVGITCKAPLASFRAVGQGGGNLEADFEDGYDSYVYGTLGEGYAKVIGAFRATGDLSYPKDSVTLGNTAGAVSSGDVEVKNLQGEVTIPYGGKVTIDFKDGEGRKITEPPLAGTDQTTTTKPAFNVNLLSYASSNIKANDSVVGRARAKTLADISHTLSVSGSCTLENTVSALVLTLNVPAADARQAVTASRKPLQIGTLRIVTVELPAGNVVEDITRNITDAGEVHYLSAHKNSKGTVGKTRIDSDWSTPLPRDASFDPPVPASAPAVAPEPLSLGTPSGGGSGPLARPLDRVLLARAPSTRATYAVDARGSTLAQIDTFSFRVTKADGGGRLTLAARSKFADGHRARQILHADITSGRGDVRGLVVPADAGIGDELYGGTGEVTAEGGGEIRVSYRDGDVRARGVYDAGTGLLEKIVERAPGGAVTKLVRIRNENARHP